MSLFFKSLNRFVRSTRRTVLLQKPILRRVGQKGGPESHPSLLEARVVQLYAGFDMCRLFSRRCACLLFDAFHVVPAFAQSFGMVVACFVFFAHSEHV